MGTPRKTTVEERFWAKVQKTDGCWLWTAAQTRGYGTFRPGSSRTTQYWYAHRWAYAQYVGEIPEGYQVDHYVCDQPLCVRPDHLKAVTQDQNLSRRWTNNKTHCKHGHEFTEDNTYVDPKGVRYCLTCRRERDKKRWPGRSKKH